MSKKEVDDLEVLGTMLKSSASKAGFLFKRGQNHQSWKRRWCVLTPRLLGYFSDEFQNVPKGILDLREAKRLVPSAEAELGGLRLSFGIETEYRVFYFQATSDRDLQRWIESIRAVLVTLGRITDEKLSSPLP